MRFEVELSLSRMTYGGRLRTVYGKVRVGRRTWWIQRWDPERDNKTRFVDRWGGSWSWGLHVLGLVPVPAVDRRVAS
jgi:hypothetical protein